MLKEGTISGVIESESPARVSGEERKTLTLVGRQLLICMLLLLLLVLR